MHILDYACKSIRQVTRSTFSAELLSAGNAADEAILISHMVYEIEHGPITVSEARQRRFSGDYVPVALYLDAKSVFGVVTATCVKIPAEKSLLTHVQYLREMLDHRVLRYLLWLDTRDMGADGLTKGAVIRTLLHIIMGGYMTIKHACDKWESMLPRGHGYRKLGGESKKGATLIVSASRERARACACARVRGCAGARGRLGGFLNPDFPKSCALVFPCFPLSRFPEILSSRFPEILGTATRVRADEEAAGRCCCSPGASSRTNAELAEEFAGGRLASRATSTPSLRSRMMVTVDMCMFRPTSRSASLSRTLARSTSRVVGLERSASQFLSSSPSAAMPLQAGRWADERFRPVPRCRRIFLKMRAGLLG